MLGTNRPRNGGGREGNSIAKNLRDFDELVNALRAAGVAPEVARKYAMGYIADRNQRGRK